MSRRVRAVQAHGGEDVGYEPVMTCDPGQQATIEDERQSKYASPAACMSPRRWRPRRARGLSREHETNSGMTGEVVELTKRRRHRQCIRRRCPGRLRAACRPRPQKWTVSGTSARPAKRGKVRWFEPRQGARSRGGNRNGDTSWRRASDKGQRRGSPCCAPEA